MSHDHDIDEVLPGEEELGALLREASPAPAPSARLREAVLAEAARRPWRRRPARPTVVFLGLAAAAAVAAVVLMPPATGPELRTRPTPTASPTATPAEAGLPAEAMLPAADASLADNRQRLARALGPVVAAPQPTESRQLLGRAQRLRAELDESLF